MGFALVSFFFLDKNEINLEPNSRIQNLYYGQYITEAFIYEKF